MKTIENLNRADRYYCDFGMCSPKKGYAQIDTGSDAEYFGIWANPTEMKIVYYIEGDETIKIASNEKEFKKEIEGIKEFHNRMNEFKGIDCFQIESIKDNFIKLGLEKLLY